MSVAFRASASAGGGSTATVSSLSITVPTSGTGGTVAAGDDAVIAVTASTSSVALTVPAGWTLVSGPDKSYQNVSWLLRKTLVAGDLAASVSLVFSASVLATATMLVGTGTTTTGLLSGALIESSTTTTPKLPTVASVPSGALVFAFMGRRFVGSTIPTLGLPAAFTAGPSAATNFAGGPELSSLAGWQVTTAAGSISGTGTSSPNTVGVDYVIAYPATGTPPPPAPAPSAVPVVSSAWPPDPYRAVNRSGGYFLTYTVDATIGGAQISGATGMQPTGGTITDTTKPGVRRTLNLELPSTPGLFDLLAPIGTTLTVTAHITYLSQQTLDIPMGVFDVDSQSMSEGGGKISLTAPDKWVRLQRAQFIGPAAGVRGMTVTAMIAKLVTDALGSSESVVVNATSTAVMGTTTWEKDRAQAIIDLATQIGAWCYFDRNGVFTIDNVPQIAASADWLIDASPSGVLVSLDRERSRATTYNVVVVSSSYSGGPKFPTQYVWDNDPNSPTYAGSGNGAGTSKPTPGTAGPFGTAPYNFDSPILTTAASAIAAGKTILARTTGLASQVSLSSAPNPALDAFDSLDVMPPKERYDIARVIERHFADTVTHSLTPNGPTQVDGRSTRTDTYTG